MQGYNKRELEDKRQLLIVEYIYEEDNERKKALENIIDCIDDVIGALEEEKTFAYKEII